MATDRAPIRRRRIFLAGEETTTGTQLTLSGSHGQFNALDREFQPDVDMVRRLRQDGFGAFTSVPGGRRATLPVTTHLHGSGGSGLPYWAFLFKCCGATLSSSTYTWSDGTSEATATMGVVEDLSRLHQMAGACGTFEMQMTAGEPVAINWEFTGKMLEPKTLTFPSPTFPTAVPPRFAAATLTVGGTSYKIGSVGFNLNADVQMREDAAADDDTVRSGDGTGYHAAQVVNIDPVFTIDPEGSAFGTKNWYQDMLDGDTAALNIVVGSDSNNTMTINAPAAQIRSASPGDRNNLIVDSLELECTGATLFTVAFS